MTDQTKQVLELWELAWRTTGVTTTEDQRALFDALIVANGLDAGTVDLPDLDDEDEKCSDPECCGPDEVEGWRRNGDMFIGPGRERVYVGSHKRLVAIPVEGHSAIIPFAAIDRLRELAGEND